MEAEKNNKDITTWSQIKDQVYGEKGTERRDNLERESESFKIGCCYSPIHQQSNY